MHRLPRSVLLAALLPLVLLLGPFAHAQAPSGTNATTAPRFRPGARPAPARGCRRLRARRPDQRAGARRGQRGRAPRPGVAHQADDRLPRVRRAARRRRSRRRRWSTSPSARGAPRARACSSSRARRCRSTSCCTGMIVQSGNDASIALAELVGGQRGGVRRADERGGGAARHGEHALRQRDRARPTRSTTRPPRDLARLAAALIRDYPEYYPLYSLKEFRYNNITQPNRNRLLWTDPDVDGVKTGHTEAAGWCLIASAHARRAPARCRWCWARRPTPRAPREPEAPQLRLPGIRHGAALPVRQAGDHAARVEGRGARGPGGLPRRPLPDAAQGQGGQARAHDGRAGAADRAGGARPARGHGEGRASTASRSPSSR